MPQYVVINFSDGVVPDDGAFKSGDVMLITAADEHAAAQVAADTWNARTDASLYATLTSNFGTHVVSRAVT